MKRASENVVQIRTEKFNTEQEAFDKIPDLNPMFGEGELLYRIYIFPEYLQDKSLIVLFNHHVLADGLSSNILFSKMLDKSSEEMLPPFKTFTLWDYFEKYFLAFFYIRSQLRSFSEMPVVDSVTKNPIRNHQKRTMKANTVISKGFSL